MKKRIKALKWLEGNFSKRMKRVINFRTTNESQEIKKAVLEIAIGLQICEVRNKISSHQSKMN